MKSQNLRWMRLAFLGTLLATALLLAGCANHYNITLTSGAVITTKGRPKYDQTTDTFRFKDLEGKPRYVPSISVKEVAPVFPGEKKDTKNEILLPPAAR